MKSKLNEIFFPNVISRNGINTNFTVYGKTIEIIESLSVYDKWGNQIYSKKAVVPNEPNLGWDGSFNGKKVISGVYVFVCKYLLFYMTYCIRESEKM